MSRCYICDFSEHTGSILEETLITHTRKKLVKDNGKIICSECLEEAEENLKSLEDI